MILKVFQMTGEIVKFFKTSAWWETSFPTRVTLEHFQIQEKHTFSNNKRRNKKKIKHVHTYKLNNINNFYRVNFSMTITKKTWVIAKASQKRYSSVRMIWECFESEFKENDVSHSYEFWTCSRTLVPTFFYINCKSLQYKL